jgi:tRNA threonylcarbamoyl adenosine modification protein (Sua5/YciO/YrdC/YwlC family)
MRYCWLVVAMTIALIHAYQSPSQPTHSFLTCRLNAKSNKAKFANLISIEDPAYDLWKIDPVIDVLRDGGVGVISTDTCYSFVTKVTSTKGAAKIAQLKGMHRQKKPMSLLCKDFSMISKYTSNICEQKWAFKLLKFTFPGPYTYIMPSSKQVPKFIVEHNHHVKRFKRKEIGIRMPDDPVCSYILEKLDEPLLCGSVPEASEDVIGMIFMKIANDEHANVGVSEADDNDDVNIEDNFDQSHDYIGDILAKLDGSAVQWTKEVEFIIGIV